MSNEAAMTGLMADSSPPHNVAVAVDKTVGRRRSQPVTIMELFDGTAAAVGVFGLVVTGIAVWRWRHRH